MRGRVAKIMGNRSSSCGLQKAYKERARSCLRTCCNSCKIERQKCKAMLPTEILKAHVSGDQTQT